MSDSRLWVLLALRTRERVVQPPFFFFFLLVSFFSELASSWIDYNDKKAIFFSLASSEQSLWARTGQGLWLLSVREESQSKEKIKVTKGVSKKQKAGYILIALASRQGYGHSMFTALTLHPPPTVLQPKLQNALISVYTKNVHAAIWCVRLKPEKCLYVEVQRQDPHPPPASFHHPLPDQSVPGTVTVSVCLWCQSPWLSTRSMCTVTIKANPSVPFQNSAMGLREKPQGA